MAATPPRPDITVDQLVFSTARSAGPGGQNVNKVETKVTLFFDVAASPSLSPEQKARIAERLRTRMSKAGVLRLSAQRQRSQSANRADVLERFEALIAAAFTDDAVRKPTRKSRAAVERRRAAKRHRSGVKKLRGAGPGEDEV